MRSRDIGVLFIGTLLVFGSLPPVVQSATARTVITKTYFTNMPPIPYTLNGISTAVKAGSTPIFQVTVYSPYVHPPTVSVDLSQLGVPSPAIPSESGTAYGATFYYKYGPFTVGADVSDGLKTIPVIATDEVGNIATATANIIVDNLRPIVSLTDITFSTTSPRLGDYMYLSGSISGTGTILMSGTITETLLNADKREMAPWPYYRAAYDPQILIAAASSTGGVFTNVPFRLIGNSPEEIAKSSFFNLDVSMYDSAGNSASTSLMVPIPKTPPPDPCAYGGCVSNVLFLPGIEASRLYRPDYDGGTDQLWEPNTDSDAQDLFLTAEGTSVRNDVYTKDVVDEAYRAGPDIYKSFIAQMNDLKTAGTIADWGAAPYDWRLSLDDVLHSGNQLADGRIYYSGDLAATSSPYIEQELRLLAKSSKTGKVTIVAHSNGGLVVKALTDKLGPDAAKLIDKIIFVAVPQAGTPQAIGALLHGYEQGLPKDWFSVFLSSEIARTFAANMSSAYNLLPSADYFTHIDDPVVTFDDSDILAEFRARYGSEIHDGTQLKNFITDARRLASSSPSDLQYPSVGNTALFSRAEAFHATADTWAPPAGVSLYEIAGWGEDTLAAIEYREGRKSYCSNPQDIRTCASTPSIIYVPREAVEGDGTVLAPSALWTAASAATAKYWVNLENYNKWWLNGNIPRKHADILEIPSLRTLIQNILTNATSTAPLAFISTSTPPTDSTQRLRFLLHSPLNLSATDTLGNIVNSSTSTIPGSRFKRYGEVQVLTVPAHVPLTLALEGYASGSFTLDMEEIDGNNAVIASSTLSAIPSATSTRATMAFTDGTLQNASPLLLDYDGSGTADFSLESKIGEAVVFDMTPPEAVLAFDPVSQRLDIVGTDNISGTTVSTTPTSATIADEAGNTLQIVFEEFKQEGKEIKIRIQELRYNGVSAEEIPKTALHYEWSVDKTGTLKELQEKTAIGAVTVNGHYDAKKSTTRIGKDIMQGLVIIGIKTEKGNVIINY